MVRRHLVQEDLVVGLLRIVRYAMSLKKEAQKTLHFFLKYINSKQKA